MKIQDKETFDKANVLALDRKTLHMPGILSEILI